MKRKCKICIFYHIKERERDGCLMIADSIKKINPDAEVIVEEFYKGLYHALIYKPDVIVTIPPRDANASNRLTIVKKIVNCAILSLVTEGYYEDFSEESIQIDVGHNEYSPYLIDKYLYWGEKTRECCVRVLKKQGKIIETDRSQAVGYVYYDIHKVKEFFEGKELPGDVQRWKKNFTKKILVLTGFQNAEVTETDLQTMSNFMYFGVKGKEKEYEKEVEKWNQIRRKFVEYRKKYLNCVIELAKSYPDIGILVKIHPGELAYFLSENKYQCYHELEQYDNIILLKEHVLIGRILSDADVLVHYGSTAGLEAYIYNVPIVQLFDSMCLASPQHPGFCIYDSTVKIDVNDCELFKKIVSSEIQPRTLEDVEKVLKEQFNWTSDKKSEYHPVRTYAEIILDSVGKGQRIENNKFYIEASHSSQGRDIKRYYIERVLKQIFQGRRKEAKTGQYQKVLKELDIPFQEYVIIVLRIVGGRIKRVCKL